MKQELQQIREALVYCAEHTVLGSVRFVATEAVALIDKLIADIGTDRFKTGSELNLSSDIPVDMSFCNRAFAAAVTALNAGGCPAGNGGGSDVIPENGDGAVPPAPECYSCFGLREDLEQLIRVCLTNPADIRGFIEANYPKEFQRYAGDESIRKDEQRGNPDCRADGLSPSSAPVKAAASPEGRRSVNRRTLGVTVSDDAGTSRPQPPEQAVEACQDTPDDFSYAIAQAEPSVTGDHATYELALRLVGNRHSKYALVDLVNYLLKRLEQRAAQLDDCRDAFEEWYQETGCHIARPHSAWLGWQAAWGHNLPSFDDVRGVMSASSERESVEPEAIDLEAAARAIEKIRFPHAAQKITPQSWKFAEACAQAWGLKCK